MSKNHPCNAPNHYCANRNKSRLHFTSAAMIKKPLWQTVWTQIRLLLVCSGSTLFASILNLSVMLGNYLQHGFQQMTFSDAFFLGALRVLIIQFPTYQSKSHCA